MREAVGTGIKAATIRADLARGRWPEPDDSSDGVNRWYGLTVAQALKGGAGTGAAMPTDAIRL